jgi:hypothetical protein
VTPDKKRKLAPEANAIGGSAKKVKREEGGDEDGDDREYLSLLLRVAFWPWAGSRGLFSALVFWVVQLSLFCLWGHLGLLS